MRNPTVGSIRRKAKTAAKREARDAHGARIIDGIPADGLTAAERATGKTAKSLLFSSDPSPLEK